MNQASVRPFEPCRFGDWAFNHSQNTLSNLASQQSQRLEPKVSDLLWLLISAHGNVVTREALIATLWPNLVVGEDTLARTVSRLRAALSDSASDPRYVETIPKRGYRWMIQVEPIPNQPEKPGLTSLSPRLAPVMLFILVSVTLAALSWFVLLGPEGMKGTGAIEEKLVRADGLYMQFEEHSNEAALELYREVLDIQSDNSKAQAGVANALVQRVVRWPEPAFQLEASSVSLSSALQSGQLDTPAARLMLERARLIAEKAVRQSPNDVQALKSLGFAYSAEGKIERAIEQYQRAIELDRNAWRSMINLGELLELQNKREESLKTFIDAFNAMQANFEHEPQHVGPWQPEMGKVIAELYEQSGDHHNAALWAEQVLQLVPFDRTASTLLISSLLNLEKTNEAKRYCESYASKLKPIEICRSLFAPAGNAN